MPTAFRRLIVTSLVASIGSITSLPMAAAAASEHVLGPGDEIEITIINQPDTLSGYNQRIVLGQEGSLSLPLTGPISVTGKTASDLAQHLQSAYRKLFAYAFVGVQLLKAAQISGSGAVFVIGQVKQTGALTPAQGTSFTLTSLIGQAGGVITTDADPEHIRIYRVAGGVEEVNFAAALRDGSGQKILLQAGDTVEVPANWMGILKQQSPLVQTAFSVLGLASLALSIMVAVRPAPAN